MNLFAYVNLNPINITDPKGLWTGIDDAVFAGGGAVVGILGRGIGDLVTWHLSPIEDYFGSFIGGAAGGMTLPYTANPYIAGAAGGLAGNLTSQWLKILTGKECELNLGSAVFDTAFGALTGLIPGRPRIAGINSGRGSDIQIFRQIITKASNGTISNISAATAIKMGRGAFYEHSVGQSAAAGAFGSTIYGKLHW